MDNQRPFVHSGSFFHFPIDPGCSCTLCETKFEDLGAHTNTSPTTNATSRVEILPSGNCNHPSLHIYQTITQSTLFKENLDSGRTWICIKFTEDVHSSTASPPTGSNPTKVESTCLGSLSAVFVVPQYITNISSIQPSRQEVNFKQCGPLCRIWGAMLVASNGTVPIHLSTESLFSLVTSPCNMWLRMLDTYTVKRAIVFNGNFVDLCIYNDCSSDNLEGIAEAFMHGTKLFEVGIMELSSDPDYFVVVDENGVVYLGTLNGDTWWKITTFSLPIIIPKFCTWTELQYNHMGHRKKKANAKKAASTFSRGAASTDNMRSKTRTVQALIAEVAYVAQAGDSQGVEQALRDLGAAHDLLRAEHDDNADERVTEVLIDVYSLLSVHAAAALDAASVPQDEQKKEILADVTTTIAHRLDDLAYPLVKDQLEIQQGLGELSVAPRYPATTRAVPKSFSFGDVPPSASF